MTLEDKPKKLVAQEEQDNISRNVLIWINKSTEIPASVGMIKYEVLQDDIACMALSTIQGAYILQKYILGGYKAEYQFKIIYRLNPGTSMDKRLGADELLNRLGAWANDNKDALQLGKNIRVLNVEPTTRSSLFAMYENGDEDHQIFMQMTYERVN